MKKVKFCDLKIGDTFKLTKNDKGIYIKEIDGASKVGYINAKILSLS